MTSYVQIGWFDFEKHVRAWDTFFKYLISWFEVFIK